MSRFRGALLGTVLAIAAHAPLAHAQSAPTLDYRSALALPAALGSTFSFNTNGYASTVIDLSNLAGATVTFYGVDVPGSTPVPLAFGTGTATTASAAGSYKFNTAGLSSVIIQVTTAGTAGGMLAFGWVETPGSVVAAAASTSGNSTSAVVNQGTAGSSAWPVSFSGGATSANQTTEITSDQLIASAIRTNDTANSSSAPRAQTHDDQLGPLVTAAGTPADTAYAGTGTASLVAGLKGLYNLLAAPLTVSQNTGVTTEISAGTGVTNASGGSSVIPAATVKRFRAIIYNLAPVSGGSTMWCRSDGGTPAVGVGVLIQPGGAAYEWDYPLVGAGAIGCIGTTAAVTVGGEYVQ